MTHAIMLVLVLCLMAFVLSDWYNGPVVSQVIVAAFCALGFIALFNTVIGVSKGPLIRR